MKRERYFTILSTFVITVGLMLLIDPLFNREDHNQAAEAVHVDEDENDHKEELVVNLSQAELDEFSIEVATAGPGILELHRDLPGEIRIDPGRLAHMIARYPGTVKEVRKSIGDTVRKGDVLAVIESNESLTLYEIRSSISGTVIEMHLSLGESVSDSDHAIMVADLSVVWADLSIFQKDLPNIRIGQTVEIEAGPGIRPTRGAISYISPVVNEETRTAIARILLPNADGRWRPGLFVSGRVAVDSTKAGILIPKTALQTIEQETVVFIKIEDGFIPQSVTLGRMNAKSVEVLAGILDSQIYVAKGGFTLKAELQKESFGAEHGH